MDAPAPAPLEPMPPSPEAQRAWALRDGCLFAPGLLAPAQTAPLRALVDAALARRGWVVGGRTDPALRLGRWDDARWVAFLAEVLQSAPYRALATAPPLLAVLRTLLGGPPLPHAGDVCRLVSPGCPEVTTPPHQDAAYLAGADGVWTAWLPLGPCPRELGPLALWPGSHLEGLRPHAPVERAGAVVGTSVPADAPWRASDLEDGDVLFFSALTVHRALPNRTADRLRVSVDFRYRRPASDGKDSRNRGGGGA